MRFLIEAGPIPPVLLRIMEEREQDHTGRSCVHCKDSLNRREAMRTKSAMSLSSVTGLFSRGALSLSCAAQSWILLMVSRCTAATLDRRQRQVSPR